MAIIAKISDFIRVLRSSAIFQYRAGSGRLNAPVPAPRFFKIAARRTVACGTNNPILH
jgi:hypothetical protein